MQFISSRRSGLSVRRPTVWMRRHVFARGGGGRTVYGWWALLPSGSGQPGSMGTYINNICRPSCKVTRRGPRQIYTNVCGSSWAMYCIQAYFRVIQIPDLYTAWQLHGKSTIGTRISLPVNTFKSLPLYDLATICVLIHRNKIRCSNHIAVGWPMKT